jgi:hypothetical protein
MWFFVHGKFASFSETSVKPVKLPPLLLPPPAAATHPAATAHTGTGGQHNEQLIAKQRCIYV